MGLFGNRKKTTQDHALKVVNARGSVGDLTAVAEQLRNAALQQVEAAREAKGAACPFCKVDVERVGIF